MAVTLLGLGTAVPARSIAQGAAAELAKAFCFHAGDHARLDTIYRRSRIDSRGSVLLEEGPRSAFPQALDGADRGPTTAERMARYARDAGPLALEAARHALRDAGVSPDTCTHLITVSCTGFAAPGLDIALIRALGAPVTIARTSVGFMGCHGALNALRVAQGFAEADPAARVLVCAVELCSVHVHYGGDADKLVANALFADGAAAAVLASGSARETGWRVAATGSCLLPSSADAMTWRIGDHGFEMTLSPRVPALIESSLRPWLDTWLARQELGLADVASWAVHPGGTRILDAVAAAAGLAPRALDVSREVLAEHGNMSSPTILFILDRLRRLDAPRPCAALAFGPGLAVEAALFR